MDSTKPRVLVIGAGFAGYHCLRTLHRRLPADAAELIMVNPTDHMLYVPLLPEVAGGTLEPRRVAVSLRGKLPRAQLVLGHAVDVDLDARTCTSVDVEGRRRLLDWDRLVITSGSVTRLLSIPGVAEHAKGFKSIAEAVYLRDHILRQIELAELAPDPAERAPRLTFVVVGAGYTGTELVAQGEQLTREALRHRPGLSRRDVHWLLVDRAPRVLPGLSERLSGPARRVLEKRGVEVRLETSVAEVTMTCVRLTDGTEIPTRTVAWCVGVRPDPMVEALGLPVEKGRLAVTTRLMSVRHNNVFGAGDVAAVPDAGQRPLPGRLAAGGRPACGGRRGRHRGTLRRASSPHPATNRTAAKQDRGLGGLPPTPLVRRASDVVWLVPSTILDERGGTAGQVLCRGAVRCRGTPSLPE